MIEEPKKDPEQEEKEELEPESEEKTEKKGTNEEDGWKDKLLAAYPDHVVEEIEEGEEDELLYGK